MTVYIVTRPAPKNIKALVIKNEGDVVIGVDGAIKDLLEQSIEVDLAVGDFDSLEDLSLLEGLKLKRLSVDKDETDTVHALKLAINMSPSKIHLIGGFKGQRADHFYANMALFDHYPDLVMEDTNTKAMCFERGIHSIRYEEIVSVFPYPEAVVSLKGFKYPLEMYHMRPYDMIGISNLIISEEGLITVHEGRVLVMCVREK